MLLLPVVSGLQPTLALPHPVGQQKGCQFQVRALQEEEPLRCLVSMGRETQGGPA